MSRSQARVLPILLLLLAPGALAHAGETHVEPGRDPETGESVAPNEGYTGPGLEPYVSFVEGTWLYGQAALTPLGDNTPRHVRGWGDWLVWEDATRGDVYAYAISAGNGYYLTSDRAMQRNPEIWDGVVVWEDYRSGTHADVYAHFLDTGETRLLSPGPGSHRRPSIHGDLVAWEDDRNGTSDVWGARLHEGGEFAVFEGPDKETDPLVLDGRVYFRTYRFNVWDVLVADAETGEAFPVTSDVNLQSAPFTNGRDVFFLTQYQGTSWRLDRFDVRKERVYETSLRASDTTAIAMSGDHALQQARDVGRIQLVARNLTAGTTQHVSGNLVLATDPFLMERTAYVAVRTKNGTSLLALDVSPFAFGKPPSLVITAPTRPVNAWTRPVQVNGLLTTGPGWTEPVTFTYRVDGGPPQVVPAGQTWRVTLDNLGVPEGNHRVVFRATFREGPPVEASLSFVVPARNANVDVAELGPRWHAAKTMAALDSYVLSNPASWLLIPLVLVLLALLLVRLWILFRPRRDVVVAEYVHQEE